MHGFQSKRTKHAARPQGVCLTTNAQFEQPRPPHQAPPNQIRPSASPRSSRTPPISRGYREVIEQHESFGLSVSVFSCWEVAKLVEKNRLDLAQPVGQWIEGALAYPGIQLFALTPEIAVESTQLPGTFHSDPADQTIVANARIHNCPLLTADEKLLSYTHVQTLT